MNKKYYFLSGMPRSGSTILAALLAQNPALHVSGTSAILGVLQTIKVMWGEVPEFSAMDQVISAERRLTTLRGALDGFYASVSQSIVIDKCRAWPGQFEMAETILGEKPKAIITVRDVRDVLASFEKLWLENKRNNVMVSQEKGNPVEYQTVEGRCRLLISQNQLVGWAVSQIVDAVQRGWKDQMLFVEYDELCADPIGMLKRIYAFLELQWYAGHQTEDVSCTTENDLPYGWGPSLHKIRSTVSPQETKWSKYLPTNVAMQYTNDARFWINL